MHALKSITFGYDVREDRILAAVNPGQQASWSCWLTRRLVLALIERAPEFIASSSALAQRATPDIRGDISTFEREAAITKTAAAMSRTADDVLKASKTEAELGERLSISKQGEGFTIEIQSDRGAGAAGVLTRAELERIMHMLEGEARKAGWLGETVKASSPAAPDGHGQPPVRH